MDLRGRMVFPFASALDVRADAIADETAGGVRTSSRDLLFHPASLLTLVLDPTSIFVTKSTNRGDKSSRGTIICSIPLLKVIAAASDRDTLHIAVQHDDVAGLIQNGNVTIQFPSSGTSLVVQQYLERSRQILREELLVNITDLFSTE